MKDIDNIEQTYNPKIKTWHAQWLGWTFELTWRLRTIDIQVWRWAAGMDAPTLLGTRDNFEYPADAIRWVVERIKEDGAQVVLNTGERIMALHEMFRYKPGPATFDPPLN